MTSSNPPEKFISEVQQEILALCMEALPLEQLEVFKSMLPGEKVPAASTADSELYSFYDKLLPDGTIELLERLSDLNYPVLDPRDLADQLGAQKDGLGAMENELISGLTLTDFPLPDFMPVFDAGIFYILKGKLRGCQRAYSRCMSLAAIPTRSESERDKAIATCRRQRDNCIDKKFVAVFSVLLLDIPRVYLHLIGRNPPGPRPWPYR